MAQGSVDFRFGAYVNAPGGLVNDQELWMGGQPFCQDDFLLVAARQDANRSLNLALQPHALRPQRGNLSFFLFRDQAETLNLSQNGQCHVAHDGHFHHQPCCWRSSGTKPIPAAIARCGVWFVSAVSPINTSPLSRGSIPKIARAISLLPAPTKPAKPTISPCRTSKLMPLNTPARCKSRTRRTTLPASTFSLGYRASKDRPTILRITSLVVHSPRGPDPTTRPSRITVIR